MRHLTFILIFFCFCGCKTVRDTEYVVRDVFHTDTAYVTRVVSDTVKERDLIYIKGDTVVRWRDRIKTAVRSDTVYKTRTDTVYKESAVHTEAVAKGGGWRIIIMGLFTAAVLIAACVIYTKKF